MRTARLILSVVVTLALITILVEAAEFLLASHTSDKSIEYLSTHQNYYFNARNNSYIYYIKPIYTLLFSTAATFIGCLIASSQYRSLFVIVLIVQSIGICYGMLFSEFRDALPIYYWLVIWFSTIAGIYLGTLLYKSIVVSSVKK